MLRRVTNERGFTMIEVMVASLVLAIGVLGLVSLVDGANGQLSKNKEREGATNVARQVIEDVNSLAYTAVDPTTITSTLQSKPGLANTGGSGWTVSSRGLSYQVSVNVSSGSSPINYRRATATVTAAANPSISVTQSTLAFPGGISASVPPVTNITSNVASPVTTSSTSSVTFTATTNGTPSGVVFFQDGTPVGTATGSGSTWTYPWPISSLSDGTYVISARSFNSSGTYSDAYTITFTLSRNIPAAPNGFETGYDPFEGSVDSQWFASPERNVVGYHVYRQETAPTPGSATQVNCGTASSPVYLVTSLNCTDASPLTTSGVGSITVGNSTSNASGGGVTSISFTKPAAVATGDVLILAVTVNGSPTITAPSGWIGTSKQTSNGNLNSAVFYKVATASEPASYTVTISKKAQATGGIVDYQGVDTSNPFDDWGSAAGASGSAVGPSVTTTSANDEIIETTGFAGATGPWNPTPPTGMTKRVQANDASSLAFVADESQASTGASGTFTTNPNGPATGWTAFTIALRSKASSLNVNYWVVACYYDTSGVLQEGTAATPINAYAADNPPNAPSWTSTPLTNLSDGTTQLQWNLSSGDPDTGDSVEMYRIYRDGQRYDTVGATTGSYIDSNPGGTTHSYYVTAVDTHMQESTPTSTVTG
jgi:prepilin-type N-terminal cleavage/methylation domain-containing protein